MSSPVNDSGDTVKLQRWQFRKKKKLEKRRQKRQTIAKQNLPPPDLPKPEEQVIVEQQQYQKAKALWEEKEEKFKAVELAKKTAREKQERAKALSQKRWHDTLLNLPTMPPNLSKDNKNNTPFKTFVRAGAEATTIKKKTYRDRFLEKKLN